MSMIKSLIFDFGNVIYPERWDLVLENFREEIDRKITSEQFKSGFKKFWDEYKCGRLNTQTFWAQVLSFLNLNNSFQNVCKATLSFKQIWKSPDEKIIRILSKLNWDHQVFGLTNSCFELEEKIEQVNKLFKKVYMSHREGIAKPKKEFYLKVIEQNQLKPEQCIFIDDKEGNIKAARNLGIIGIRYQNPEQLQTELTRFKIKIV